tara:strand:+ start:932 stop:1609 length:678 start_codon:yes stop_codon:yes gene_type:complete
MRAEEVAQYLQEHPQFFDEYADLLADIRIAHPYNDKVISINERQVITLRDKNRLLQDKLLELISFGEENDAISEKIHRLSIALLTTSNIDELFNVIDFSLRKDFTIDHIALRLWNISCDDMERIEFTATSTDVRAIAESLSQPYCGTHIADEIKVWFGEDATQMNSYSMIPLKMTQSIGLLVLGSPEPERFYPEMGTLHLKRLGDLVSTALTRYDRITVANPKKD